jgi:hypothetical protein
LSNVYPTIKQWRYLVDKEEKRDNAESLPVKYSSSPSMGVLPQEANLKVFEEFADCEEYSSGFPQTITWMEEGQYCKGRYIGCRENVGRNKSKVYSISCNNEEINIWGTTILDQLFEKSAPRIGDLLCIVYDGECPSARGLNPVKLFTLLVKRMEHKS